MLTGMCEHENAWFLCGVTALSWVFQNFKLIMHVSLSLFNRKWHSFWKNQISKTGNINVALTFVFWKINKLNYIWKLSRMCSNILNKIANMPGFTWCSTMRWFMQTLVCFLLSIIWPLFIERIFTVPEEKKVCCLRA